MYIDVLKYSVTVIFTTYKTIFYKTLFQSSRLITILPTNGRIKCKFPL